MAKKSAREFCVKIGKIKWVYPGFRTVYDGKGLWSFGNDFARKVVIFCVDNSSSFHADNCKNVFLVLADINNHLIVFLTIS